MRGSSASGLGGVIVLAVVDTAGHVRIMGHTYRDRPGTLTVQPIRRREGDLITKQPASVLSQKEPQVATVSLEGFEKLQNLRYKNSAKSLLDTARDCVAEAFLHAVVNGLRGGQDDRRTAAAGSYLGTGGTLETRPCAIS